jgi:hypothetical protein
MQRSNHHWQCRTTRCELANLVGCLFCFPHRIAEELGILLGEAGLPKALANAMRQYNADIEFLKTGFTAFRALSLWICLSALSLIPYSES